MSRFALSVGVAGLIVFGRLPRTVEAAPAASPAVVNDGRSADSADATPPSLPGSEPFVFRRIGDVELRLHVVKPPGWNEGDRRPCLVAFFGGGWNSGTPERSIRWAKWAADLGLVGIAPDYRTRNRHGTRPEDCVADGRAAVRWIAAHADELGIDPGRIVALGSSAGGHVAAWTAIPMFGPGGDDPPPGIVPAALILLNPVTDTKEGGYGGPKRFGGDAARALAISVPDRMPDRMPPTIVFHGTADESVPYSNSVAFRDMLVAQGNRCELVTFEGLGHSYYSSRWGEAGRAADERTRRDAAAFLASLGLVPGSSASPSVPPRAEVVREAIATSARQYEWMLAHLPDEGKMPRTFEHGKLVTVIDHDWTVGFFPGSLWSLYEATGDPQWRAAAERYTRLLIPEQDNTRTHDVGFILNCSFGNGYRLTGEASYRAVLLKGAASLGARFSPVVGCIKSWDRDPSVYTFPVIIDNMMNLELLLLAAREGGDPRFRAIAMAHADTTLRNHFRPDGSSFHVVDYDPATGRVLRRVTHQGAADDSAWARGQAWGLYGYAMMFRETREERYLGAAEKIAAFILNHPRMPPDKVPFWDFDAPGQPDAPRDSSAAAIMSSALFELAGLTRDPRAAARYVELAEAQVRSLASPAYLAAPGTNGGFLLMHATGNHPRNSEVDTPLNYADYYFLEALLRCRARLGAAP
jgi:unsaturated chondroitin disaccharide hydrolase